ncbi:hypothetical protein GUITHDRAFT_108403 [Guillardia theta CCMP2712]|uniref:Uncharacterized protein n=1 Tax=Guillardia theta (strain CCMP2712) TaxID=905079 RepID=L1JBN0_GUITC|nr:hypothetical protein GUITHDRAFT_108403 [Guillardia theta CCMP2712]EKX45529.1 hypothetical protein GUITHDRAFT_108403 [Guillardia theta CCMP2712]|eukprot:XP_005832509.1 hypothetical protein GUITHDRAFT_108403 [Guillardia theta CCMP2712]
MTCDMSCFSSLSVTIHDVKWSSQPSQQADKIRSKCFRLSSAQQAYLHQAASIASMSIRSSPSRATKQDTAYKNIMAARTKAQGLIISKTR